jgi:pimeloyl-ACP methyl ester carboxylesterase
MSADPSERSADRYGFAFSRSGKRAVSTRTGAAGLTLEHWSFDGPAAARASLTGVEADRATHALPTDDGRLLLFQRADGVAPGGQLALVGGDGPRRGLGAVPAPLGGYLLAGPGALGYVVALHGEHSRIWRLPGERAEPELVAELPGVLSGGVWLDGETPILGVNQADPTGGTRGVAVDLRRGECKTLLSLTGTSTDRLLYYSPLSKRLVVDSDASGVRRIGVGTLGAEPVSFPDALHRPDAPVEVLAADEPGETLLLHEVAGATSRLSAYTPAGDRLASLADPAGTILAPAVWNGDGIRCVLSVPGSLPAPRSLGELQRGEHPVARAELTELPGAAGPVEAIAYGGSGWAEAEHLVLALHGGPLSGWRFRHEPLFEYLVAGGLAALAPNYRGSTGYGAEHVRAVLGDWGGPDVADVCRIATDLAARRARRGLLPPVVYGASYGGYLALLAACRAPALFSGCVAVSPFTSPRELHAESPAAVRARIEELGGLRDPGGGSRDVLECAPALRAPLLLVHGRADETVPVSQSRALADRLAELACEVEFLECPGDHATPAGGRDGALNARVVEFCRSVTARRGRSAAGAAREDFFPREGAGPNPGPGGSEIVLERR